MIQYAWSHAFLGLSLCDLNTGTSGAYVNLLYKISTLNWFHSGSVFTLFFNVRSDVAICNLNVHGRSLTHSQKTANFMLKNNVDTMLGKEENVHIQSTFESKSSPVKIYPHIILSFRNTKGDILQNDHAALFHTLKTWPLTVKLQDKNVS